MKARVLKFNALIYEGRIAKEGEIIEIDKDLAVQYSEMGLVEIIEEQESKTQKKAVKK